MIGGATVITGMGGDVLGVVIISRGRSPIGGSDWIICALHVEAQTASITVRIDVRTSNRWRLTLASTTSGTVGGNPYSLHRTQPTGNSAQSFRFAKTRYLECGRIHTWAKTRAT
jgi:hypothetical protein